MLAAVSLLQACANSPEGVAKPTVQIPAAPAYLAEVQTPPPRVGEPWPVYAARERAGREDANARLRAGAKDWQAMKGTLEGARPAQ